MPVKLLLNILAKELLRKIKIRDLIILFSLKARVLSDCLNQKQRVKLNQINSRNILNSNRKLLTLINLLLNFKLKIFRLKRIYQCKSQQEYLKLVYIMLKKMKLSLLKVQIKLALPAYQFSKKLPMLFTKRTN